MHIPQSGLRRQVFDSDFAFHLGPAFAQPHDAKLSLRSFILEVNNIAGLQLYVDALQAGAAATDRAQTRGLGEGTRMGVHSPNAYRQIHENALLLAAVHRVIVGAARGKARYQPSLSWSSESLSDRELPMKQVPPLRSLRSTPVGMTKVCIRV